MYVLREVSPGMLLTEVIVGDGPGPHPVAATVIDRNHMRMLEMTPELHKVFLDMSLSRGHPTFFPAVGWKRILRDHADNAHMARCITPASCRCCRLNKQRGHTTGRHSGRGDEDPGCHRGGESALPRFLDVHRRPWQGRGARSPPNLSATQPLHSLASHARVSLLTGTGGACSFLVDTTSAPRGGGLTLRVGHIPVGRGGPCLLLDGTPVAFVPLLK